MKSSLPYWSVALAVLVGVVWTGWLGQRHLQGLASPIDRAETVLLDMRILAVGSRPAPKDVVIVGIDDDTVAKAGRYPIGRDRLADLVGKIRDAGAKALGIDMLLVGKTDETADVKLTAALGSLPSVIAAAGVFKDENGKGENRPVSIVPTPGTFCARCRNSRRRRPWGLSTLRRMRAARHGISRFCSKHRRAWRRPSACVRLACIWERCRP
ncbi:CHASE2 domain-containing protein [Roseibium aggregatum]|uniref:CHASE2 domain-containing protein n=1 Tax=Roseibium aggregatum TaxID=187304 RepID=UPI001AD8A1FD|nr:CHASE2 domain-containing protein [Roseibium aggregatum]